MQDYKTQFNSVTHPGNVTHHLVLTGTMHPTIKQATDTGQVFTGYGQNDL